MQDEGFVIVIAHLVIMIASMVKGLSCDIGVHCAIW